MDVRAGLWELMLLNCGVGEDSWESLGLQGDPTSPSERKLDLNVHGRTDVKAETPILWPPDAKSWLIGKDSDAGRDWGQEELVDVEYISLHGYIRNTPSEQTCMQNTSWEWTGVHDQQKRIYRPTQNSRSSPEPLEWVHWLQNPRLPEN